MSVIPNEMLQDPAILLTSKNSISASCSMSPNTRHSPRRRHSLGGNMLPNNSTNVVKEANAQSGNGQTATDGGAVQKKLKSAKSPKVAKKSRSQTRSRRRRASPSNQENVSPQANRSRRSRRVRQQKNSNSLETTSSEAKAVRGPFIVNNSPPSVIPAKSGSLSPPFKRYSAPGFNRFNKNRFPSDLNPYARSFLPQLPLKPGLSNEYVSQEIIAYHQRNRQSNEKYKSKQILRQGLENTLKQAFPQHFVNLYIIGSSTNGIGDNVSTVDICVVSRKRQSASVKSPTKATPETVTEKNAETIEDVVVVAEEAKEDAIEVIESTTNENEMEVESPQVIEVKEECDSPKEVSDDAEAKALEPVEKIVFAAADSNCDSSDNPHLTLEKIEQVLRGKNFAQNIKVIPAKVPIIKFKDIICNLDVTLNLNQDISIRNSQLIRDYAKMDWRFPHLAMIMKQWARENRINSAVDKAISSYSWTLMVIHFLQVVEPPVLPCLQKLFPRRYDPRMGIEQAMNVWRRPPNKWRSNNNSNLRQLLKAMFRYYGYVFSYDQHVISVREGKFLDKSQCQNFRSGGPDEGNSNPTIWNSFLCTEEPFNRTNTTRSVHDKEVFERIIELFRTSSNALKGNRISLFNIIADDLEFPITY